MFKIIFASILFCTSVLADQVPPTIQSVGAITIYTSLDMKVLADWYQKFGFNLQFDKKEGVYWGNFKGQAGPPYFGIHPKEPLAPEKSSQSISLVFRVSDYAGYVSLLEQQGLKAESIDPPTSNGWCFANYRDPDRNKMTIWGDCR